MEHFNYNYTDYIITQSGTKLSTDSTIKIIKYENKVTRFVFKVEDRLKPFRLYFAIQNPVTERYHYEPLLYDGEDYYLVVGTSISYYAKEKTKSTKLKAVLIAVQPSFILDDNITLDDTATIYTSEEFVKIVILNTFINDYAVDVSMPNLDIALDNFMVLHDDVVQLSIQTAQDLVDCNLALEQCEKNMAKCDEDLEKCEADAEACTRHEIQCATHENSTRQNLTDSQQVLSECNRLLTESRQILTACNTSASSANAALSNCQIILTQCQASLTAMTAQYNEYMTSMRNAYNEYIQSIRQGGEP